MSDEQRGGELKRARALLESLRGRFGSKSQNPPKPDESQERELTPQQIRRLELNEAAKALDKSAGLTRDRDFGREPE